MGSKRINKIKFLSINRDIKEALASGTYKTQAIADKHGIGVSTVRSIKRAKTWPAFVTAKQNYMALRYRGKSARFEKAKQLHTATPTESDGAPDVTRKLATQSTAGSVDENRLSEEMKRVRGFVTRTEYRLLLRTVQQQRERIERLEVEIAKSRRPLFSFGSRER